MPEEDNEILKYNHGEKSMIQPLVIYFDFESLLEKIDTCSNDLEKSLTTKINKHIPSVYSLFTCFLFDAKENKLHSYRGEDFMKMFCENLSESVLRIISYKKKKITILTEEERKAHRKAKICYICRKEFSTDNEDKNNYKVRDHCHYTAKYRGAAHNICNLRYNTPRKISVIAHNASTYDYHEVLQFNQEAWLKPYTDMNIKLKKEAKNDFEKDFFKLMINAVFGKPMENVIKHRDIKLVTTDKRRNQLVSEPDYHAIEWFSDNLEAIEMRNTEVKMNKPIYLGMAILDTSKILMYEFWYEYLKPKYGYKIKLCYMDTDNLIPFIKTEDFYEDIADDVQKRFNISNYEVDRPLITGKNKKAIGLMKDELEGRIMTEFIALRPKSYAYQTDDNSEVK